jgi:hypothetical protein
VLGAAGLDLQDHLVPDRRAGQGGFAAGADAGLLIVLATSPRVAPGLLSWPAWEALRSASAVLAPDALARKRLATTCALSLSDAPHKAGTHRRPAVLTTPTAAHGAPHSAAHHLPDHMRPPAPLGFVS